MVNLILVYFKNDIAGGKCEFQSSLINLIY